MAIVRIPEQGRTLKEKDAISRHLEGIGIEYRTWTPEHPTSPDAPSEEILASYKKEIDALKTRGGYKTADVINVTEATPGLEAMLARFRREHWHDEDEVRFILAGRGVFFIHPKDGPVTTIEVESGDLIRVPRGTMHWFDLCADKQIRAIRLFQDPGGWTPQYTGSGAETQYDPVCLGPAYLN